MCRNVYARSARGGGDLELIPQGFRRGVFKKFVSGQAARLGFTLAEVLITLGIIGVVAALTLPALIQNYQKKATATSVKKAYSELNQVIQMAKADYGDPSGWDYYEQDNLAKWVQTYIEPYIKVVQHTDSCMTNVKCLGLALPAPLKSKPGGGNSTVGHYVLTKTGDSFGYAFYRYGSVYESETRVRVYIRNSMKYPSFGKKAYAFVGKDIFTFVFDKRKANPMFQPYGMGTSREDLLADRKMWAGACNKSAGGSGYWTPGDACAAVIMLDNWEIKDDYPW